MMKSESLIYLVLSGTLTFFTQSSQGWSKGDTSGYVQTVAGGGAPHQGGTTDCKQIEQLKDGIGNGARFSYPWGITYHAQENTLYIGDCSCPDLIESSRSEKIRKIVVETGQVTTLAGSVAGFRDGPGQKAQFNHVSGMVVDSSTNVMYVVDSANARIRKIDLSSGVVSTYAGNQEAGFRDAVGVKAMFKNPQSILLDSAENRLFIGDTDNHAIRIIALKDASVKTLTGGRRGLMDGHSKRSKFFHPTGLAFDSANHLLYVADHYNHVIRTVDTRTGHVTTLAGGGRQGFQDGVGKAARFNYPEGIAYDAEYHVLYVVEFGNSAVRMVTSQGKVTTLAGGYSEGYVDGFGKQSRLYHPTGLALDTNDKIIYVTDQYNHLVRSITALGYNGRLPQKDTSKAEGTGSYVIYLTVLCVGVIIALLMTKRFLPSLMYRRRR